MWVDSENGLRLHPVHGFVDERGDLTDGIIALNGFDTFWYIWSTTHEGVTLFK